MQMKCILMMGTFDSKGKEFEYLYRELLRREVKILTMDTGILSRRSSLRFQSHPTRWPGRPESGSAI